VDLRPDYFTAGWRGQLPLSEFLWASDQTVRFTLLTVLGLSIVLFPISVPVIAVFCLWLFVAIWRCAFNAEWQGWGYIIRIGMAVAAFAVLVGS
jgi:hypothetical protein